MLQVCQIDIAGVSEGRIDIIATCTPTPLIDFIRLLNDEDALLVANVVVGIILAPHVGCFLCSKHNLHLFDLGLFGLDDKLQTSDLLHR